MSRRDEFVLLLYLSETFCSHWLAVKGNCCKQILRSGCLRSFEQAVKDCFHRMVQKAVKYLEHRLCMVWDRAVAVSLHNLVKLQKIFGFSFINNQSATSTNTFLKQIQALKKKLYSTTKESSPVLSPLTLAKPDVRVLTSFVKWNKALT